MLPFQRFSIVCPTITVFLNLGCLPPLQGQRYKAGPGAALVPMARGGLQEEGYRVVRGERHHLCVIAVHVRRSDSKC